MPRGVLTRRSFTQALLCQSLAAVQAHADTVDVRDYSAFWLWAGVKPQPVLDTADEIYVLQGEVNGVPQAHIVPQRSATPRITHAKVWMVYRAHAIPWPDAIVADILGDLARWKAAGNNLVGLQIDFDSGTRNLDRYAGFLRDFRQALPEDYSLSVTGLLDWSANAGKGALSSLKNAIDEIVIQTYQGRRIIRGYADYLAHLGRLELPFRIGLVQGGEWTAPSELSANPWFRGYVVFLLNLKD